ncbi:MAG TPA: GGDEF domain-containing protein [Gemmatimonadales bacterium]|nr:GGDEF domain-containing protein [Gemmatimonadales bacterium]
MTQPRPSGARRLTPVQPWPLTGTVDEHVRAETVRALYYQAIAAPTLTLLVAALVAADLWRVTPRERLLVWLGIITLLSLVRLALVLAYRRRVPPTREMITWEHAFVYTLVAICLAWGVGVIAVMPASLAHQAFIFFFLLGIAGGAVASYAVHPTACLLSITTLLVPVTVWFLFQNALELRLMAAGGVLYLITAIRATRNYGQFWRRTFELSWELQQAHALAQKLARTDELTGINNRRAFTSLGHNALEQARRYDRPLSLVLFDIDHFKAINDTYGHAAGDKVLQAVARIMLRSVRTPDIPGRFGGEEFTVLLPETSAEEAVVFAERLRADLERLKVDFNGQTIRVSCSFGVASRGEAVSLDTLLMRADEALYRAKHEGRNRVVAVGAGAT